MAHWFLVEIYFEVLAGAKTIQHHTQWRLLQAQSSDGAVKKAAEIGSQEGQSVLADLRNLLKWHFTGVGTVMMLEPAMDGAEVLSHFTKLTPASVG